MLVFLLFITENLSILCKCRARPKDCQRQTKNTVSSYKIWFCHTFQNVRLKLDEKHYYIPWSTVYIPVDLAQYAVNLCFQEKCWLMVRLYPGALWFYFCIAAIQPIIPQFFLYMIFKYTRRTLCILTRFLQVQHSNLMRFLRVASLSSRILAALPPYLNEMSLTILLRMVFFSSSLNWTLNISENISSLY